MNNGEIAMCKPTINPANLGEIADVVARSSESFDQSCDRVLDCLRDEAMNLELSSEERRENHEMQMDVLNKKGEKVTENRMFAAFIILAMFSGFKILTRTNYCGKATKTLA